MYLNLFVTYVLDLYMQPITRRFAAGPALRDYLEFMPRF